MLPALVLLALALVLAFVILALFSGVFVHLLAGLAVLLYIALIPGCLAVVVDGRVGAVVVVLRVVGVAVHLWPAEGYKDAGADAEIGEFAFERRIAAGIRRAGAAIIIVVEWRQVYAIEGHIVISFQLQDVRTENKLWGYAAGEYFEISKSWLVCRWYFLSPYFIFMSKVPP